MKSYQQMPLNKMSGILAEFLSPIKDPVIKLKLTQRVLARYSKTASIKKLPVLRVLTCHQIALEESKNLHLPDVIDVHKTDRRVRARMATRKHIHVVGLVGGFLCALFLVSYTTQFLVQGASKIHSANLEQVIKRSQGSNWESLLPIDAAKTNLHLASHSMDSTPRADRPLHEIWLVEKRPGYEFYSNGLRILTDHETNSFPREYYAFRREGPMPTELSSRPIGILYHTSEGDILPFSSQYNNLLTQTTKGLLAYVKQGKFYNYVIDRFGRVYRIVKDDQTANHAGSSIWSNNDIIYIGLNQSFIGICFEGRWTTSLNRTEETTNAGDSSTISGAQVQAARLLTELLRKQHQIPDRNCVTHGLTSINPKTFLIGHHLDWARNFPFQEIGLEDKYNLPLPSMIEFGFDYDNFFLKKVGEPPLAADLATRVLIERAARRNISLGALRTTLHRDFEKKLMWSKTLH